MIYFPIGLAVTIYGAFFPIVVVFDASTTLADEFIVFGSFFRCNLFLFMLDWNETKVFQFLSKTSIILGMIFELGASSYNVTHEFVGQKDLNENVLEDALRRNDKKRNTLDGECLHVNNQII